MGYLEGGGEGRWTVRSPQVIIIIFMIITISTGKIIIIMVIQINDKALPRLVYHQEGEGSHVYLSTSSRVAGAIDSLVWKDKEFING